MSKPARDNEGQVRLQKLLASLGCGSRRACEELITEGRVEVDGRVVDQLGSKVNPETQKVTLDGERLVTPRLEYFALNKPPGVVSTSNDPSGRLRVVDLIKSKTRVYNVGRLDKSSEGLILVTNDGDLANKLTHPRYGVEKKYHVLVVGVPDIEKLSRLKQGIYLAEARVQVKNIKIKKRQRDRTWLEIVLDEGRNREIRRILARIGHKVVQLRRVAIGPLKLDDLPQGAHRRLTMDEVRLLRRFAEKAAASNPKKKKSAKKPTVKKKLITGLSAQAKKRKKKSAPNSSKKKSATRKFSKSSTTSKKKQIRHSRKKAKR